MEQHVTFTYKNWRGETGVRVVIPGRIYFAATEHHPTQQWIMEAFDVEKQATRHFTLQDITGWSPFTKPVREISSLTIEDILLDFPACKQLLETASHAKRSELLRSLYQKELIRLSKKEADNLILFLNVVQEDEMIGYVITMVDKITEEEIRINPTYKYLFYSFSKIIDTMTKLVK